MADILTKGIRSIYDSVTKSETDFRNADIVISLGMFTPAMEEDAPADIYVYVGKDGSGEIKSVDAQDFAKAQNAGLGHFLEVSHLSDNAVRQYQNVIQNGAASLASEAGDYSNPPMEKGFAYKTEGMESVPRDLGESKQSLTMIRDNFDSAHNPEKAQEVYEKIDVILNQIDIAQSLPDYKDDLVVKVSEKLGADIALGVQEELKPLEIEARPELPARDA